MAIWTDNSRKPTGPEIVGGRFAAGTGGGEAPNVRSAVENVIELKDRRRRRRVAVQPMYTRALVRVLGKREEPLEGHVVNLSETGMVVEVDEQIGIGQPIVVEFCVAGMGRMKGESWPMYAAAAEVVRIDDLDDFPMGPYKIAVKFVRIATMVQGQIARFVAMQPESASR